MTRAQIARATALVMLGSVASRALGVAREAVVLGLYGLSEVSSAFVTAATVPTMLFDLLVGGAISAALIPVFSEYSRRGEREHGRVAGALLVLTLAALGALVVVLEIVAPLIVDALGAGGRPALRDETTGMLRILLPSVLFLGASGVVQAILQARGTFGYTAISTSAFNLGIVAAGLGLSWAFGPAALALGVLLGAGLQLAIQLPGLRGVALELLPDWRHPGVRRALKLYIPVAGGLLLSQAAIVLDRYLAWSTGEASIALMRSATTLVQLPLGLVATALAAAVLPQLTRAAEDEPVYRATLALGVRVALLAMVPMTTALVLLREPVVRLLFERGAFGAADTELTGLAFLWYAPQMPFWAVDQLLIVAFYARRDTWTPVLVGVAMTLLYVAVALGAVGPLGVFGLILANTLQNSLHCVVLYILLRRRGLGLEGLGIWVSLGRALAASAAAAAAYAGAVAALGPAPLLTIAALWWLGLVGVAMGLAGVATLLVLRTPDLLEVAAIVRRRLA